MSSSSSIRKLPNYRQLSLTCDSPHQKRKNLKKQFSQEIVDFKDPWFDNHDVHITAKNKKNADRPPLKIAWSNNENFSLNDEVIIKKCSKEIKRVNSGKFIRHPSLEKDSILSSKQDLCERLKNNNNINNEKAEVKPNLQIYLAHNTQENHNLDSQNLVDNDSVDNSDQYLIEKYQPKYLQPLVTPQQSFQIRKTTNKKPLESPKAADTNNQKRPNFTRSNTIVVVPLIVEKEKEDTQNNDGINVIIRPMTAQSRREKFQKRAGSAFHGTSKDSAINTRPPLIRSSSAPSTKPEKSKFLASKRKLKTSKKFTPSKDDIGKASEVQEWKNAAQTGSEIVTMVSLISPSGSENEDASDDEKERPKSVLKREISVGEKATKEEVGGKDNAKNVSLRKTVKSDIKRIIGRRFDDVYVQGLIKSQEYRYKILSGKDNRVVIPVYHNKRTVYKSPEEICSEILKYLKESASEYLGVEVSEAVISVPAHFSNAQRKATRAAAELAGLKVLKLITEPVAAAIHYSIKQLNKKSTLLVFDFGGGTLDVSIIEVNGKRFSVKSVEGDSFLGGRDIDQILLEHFEKEILDKFGENVFDNDNTLRRVKKSCIRIKTKLSTFQNFSIPLDFIGGNENQKITLSMTRKEFQQLSNNLFKRATNLIDRCLKEAGMTKKDMTDVVLVGGTTRIPKVRTLLTQYFSDKEIRTNLNPDEAVALGAGVQAALFRKKFQELEKYKITEITPLSLGTSLNGGLMSVAIKKNSPLPTKSKPIYSHTSGNNQRKCSFKIYEGERRNCEYNNLLGKFTIRDLPLGRAGDIEFETVFSLNEDGILEVDVQENSTGKSRKLVVTIGEYRLSDHKIRHTIEDSESNRLDDEIFETFTRYFSKVKKICNYVLYDIDKISVEVDRDFVQSKCELFLEISKKIGYKEIEKLKSTFNTFEKQVKGIVEDVMEVNFGII